MAAVMMEASPDRSSLSSSGSTSPSRKRHSNLSLDFSDLPPLTQPTPPSNTLIITGLEAPEIFATSNLTSIRQAIDDQASVYAFSPLRSFRRIICVFYSTDDAIRIRQLLDGETVLGHRVRVYFGVETRIDPEDVHLKAPRLEKQFLISPPPSPPMGWEVRQEDPPNTDVHAEDLAIALAKLNATGRPVYETPLRVDSGDMFSTNNEDVTIKRTRSGTASFVVFDPLDHGHSPDLPAISVEDTSGTFDELTPVDEVPSKFVHTSRPPVELM